jgi:hypothetical protein
LGRSQLGPIDYGLGSAARIALDDQRLGLDADREVAHRFAKANVFKRAVLFPFDFVLAKPRAQEREKREIKIFKSGITRCSILKHLTKDFETWDLKNTCSLL